MSPQNLLRTKKALLEADAHPDDTELYTRLGIYEEVRPQLYKFLVDIAESTYPSGPDVYKRQATCGAGCPEC